MKICFVASSGGHWEELMCLEQLMKNHDCFFVTEKGGQSSDSKLENIYELSQINRREKYFFLHFLQLMRAASKLLRKERPDVIISTGALIAFPFCLLGKLSGEKIIYIESFARVNDGSLTGKLVYPFADLFLVQWHSMLSHFPKAKYIGGIF